MMDLVGICLTETIIASNKKEEEKNETFHGGSCNCFAFCSGIWRFW